jgi:hypothetical protein
MQKISEQTVGRTNGAVARFLGFMGRGAVGGVILFLTLLLDPSPGFGAPLPGASVNLAWNGSPSAEVTGYRIYYGSATGSYTNSVAVGNVMAITVPGLTIGVPYYFVVVAFDASGMESLFSNEIIYIVPGGLAQLQLRVAANKQAILTLTGQVGHTYEIQATANLTTWSVLGTVTLGAGGSANYTNANAGSFPTRFYRTRDTTP